MIIITTVGILLIVVAIMWVLPTGSRMDDGWHTLHADPGQKVKLIVFTNDDPVVIYIITADTSNNMSWHLEEPPDHIGRYEVPANSRGTIELQLPEDDDDDRDNWGFYFNKKNGFASITYRQTRPIVEDHFFYTWVTPTFLMVLLVAGLGMNHYLRRVDLRDLEELERSRQ